MRLRIIALLLVVVTSVQSEPATTENLTGALQKCLQIESDFGRLVCYDNLSKAQQQVTDSQSVQAEAKPDNSIRQAEVSDDSRTAAKQLPVLVADIDEPSLMYSLGRMDLLGKEFDAMLIGLGHRKNIYDFDQFSSHDIHVNVMGHIRSQFDVDEIGDRNNRGGALINTDFMVGGELVQRRDNWQWRLAYTHRSTHLGDEFLIDNQDYLTNRTNLSYEKIDFLALKSISNWDVYAGAAFITRIEPGYLEKYQFQAGWQFSGHTFGHGRPVIGMDLKSWQAAERPVNVTLRAGFEFNEWLNRPFNIMLEYQEGHAPYGQFFTEDFSYFGLSIYNQW